jgi:hypothetical protein
MSKAQAQKRAGGAWCRPTFAPGLSRERGDESANTSEAISIEPAKDKATPDAAASMGIIDLYDGDDGRVGVDGCVPNAVATEMVRAAVGLDHIGFKLSCVDGVTSIQVQAGDVAALLAPAERDGVKIIDGRDVAQPRNGESV